MKNALKIAAFVLPLMAITANAKQTNNKKQNNYYKATVTGQVYVQDEGDDYSADRFKTNDLIGHLLKATGWDGDWNVKDCDLVMQLPDHDDSLVSVNWWLYHKKGKVSHKVNVTGYVSLFKTEDYVSVVKRKYTGKGDNEKARWEFAYATVDFEADTFRGEGTVAGTTDVTLKGMNSVHPYLNNVKLRSSGQFSAYGRPGKIDLKIKGRVTNAAMEDAKDLTPVR